MTKILIEVPGPPVAQPRHDATARGRKVWLYIPVGHPVHEYKKRIARAAHFEHPDGLLSGPLGVKAWFVMPRPKRLRWKSRPMERLFCDKKPDLDNLAKSVMDALTAVIWDDDRQVAQATFCKFYAAGDEEPHTLIKVYQLSESDERML